MEGKLIKLWEMLNTKQLANIFEQYMKNKGIRKYDGRRKSNCNTYMIDGNSTG